MIKRGLILILVSTLILTNLANAELTLSEPNSAYSVNDLLNLTLFVSTESESNDYLIANLNCDSGSQEIYKNLLNLGNGEQKNIRLQAKLEQKFIPQSQGNCYIQVEYGDQEIKSNDFVLSDKITLEITSQGFVNPGESILIEGSASKSDGVPLTGKIVVDIPRLDISFNEEIYSGEIKINVPVADDSEAGIYELKIEVYDLDNKNKKANSGTYQSIVKVSQVASELDLAIEKTEINAGEEVSFKVLVLDQAENVISQEIEAIIKNSAGEIVFQNAITSGKTYQFKTNKTDKPGDWEIYAHMPNKETSKVFSIIENEHLSYIVDGNALLVINDGNIVVNKQVEIYVGQQEVKLDIELNPGESKEFLLTAPDGVYTIIAKEEQKEIQLGSATLTGRVVDVREPSQAGSKNKYLLWIILIIILLGLAILTYRKISKRNHTGFVPKKFIHSTKKENYINFVPESKETSYKERRHPEKLVSEPKLKKLKIDNGAAVEHSPIGNKEEATSVAISLKNKQQLKEGESSIFSLMAHLASLARNSKGRIKEEGEFLIAIFAPSATKDNQNELRALKFAQRADSALKEHNKKYALKAQYGIGIHLGEMIIEKRLDKTRFISVGNTLLGAKKAANKAQNMILESTAFHRKSQGLAKTEAMPGENYWKVMSIKEKSQHEEFIQQFMQRQRRN